MSVKRNQKNTNIPKTWLRDHTWLHYEKEAMFCYFLLVGNLIRRQTPLHRQKGEPLMFGLEPTEELVLWTSAITKCHGTEKTFVIAGSSL